MSDQEPKVLHAFGAGWEIRNDDGGLADRIYPDLYLHGAATIESDDLFDHPVLHELARLAAVERRVREALEKPCPYRSEDRFEGYNSAMAAVRAALEGAK